MMEDIKVDEVLSRYILDKTHIRYSNRTVKYSAFLPAPDGTTSVFRVSGLTEEQVWEVGDREVALKRQKPLVGRADITAAHVLKAGLELDADNNPPLHANINGWPVERSGQKLIALKLAEDAQLYLKI